ncbi:UNVERIFIED_CONTAM: hypothetical protein Scaly_2570100 [Sesamum calycinum]|uniref:Tetratricopeptide repeat (TPR)-like superfamily protein n=1 Tax=Sesamum calycinum TaxID=2727403 RepID=A0AAW2JU43_9LAMI
MALWMEAGSEPKTNEEIVDLEAIAALKESAAIELKEKGNEYVKMGKKHYSDAIDCYTRAINQKALGNSESSIIYSNRAMSICFWEITDGLCRMLRRPSNFLQQMLRAVKAALSLNLMDEAKSYCEKGLQQSPDNEELKKLDKQIDVKISEQQQREAEVSKAVAAAKDLVSAFEDRRIKFGKAMYQELTGIKKPMLDKNKILHWPVLLLYAEVMSSDIIEDFCETDISPPLPWDTENAYTRDAIELYYEADSGVCLSKKEILSYLLEGTAASHLEKFGVEETNATHSSVSSGTGPKWVRVNEKRTLHDILKSPNIIIPGIPVFFVVSKKSNFYKDFKLGNWAPPQ